MKIRLNGQERDFSDAASLQQVIDQVCRTPRPVIAELNGQIVRRSRWPETVVRPGDCLELVGFVGGG